MKKLRHGEVICWKSPPRAWPGNVCPHHSFIYPCRILVWVCNKELVTFNFFTEYMGEGGGHGGCGHGGGREWGGFLCNNQKSLTCLPGMCVFIYSARLYNNSEKPLFMNNWFLESYQVYSKTRSKYSYYLWNILSLYLQTWICFESTSKEFSHK